jgi:protein SCO1/2
MTPARAITRFCALIAASLLLAPAAFADFTRAQLASISASPAPDAALPLDLSFRQEDGQPITVQDAIGGVPAMVVFADYTCRTLCGPILEFAAVGLGKTGLRPGTDYRLIVIGLDAKDSLESARAMRANHIAPGNLVGKAAMFLSGDQRSIDAATQALGLHTAYDAAHDQFAHPAAVYVLDTSGQVRRLLSPLGLDGGDLRLALIDAGRGRIGSFADRIHLLCYGYDPVRGIYTERITTLLGLAAGATLVVLAGGILVMIARERRRVAS